MGFITNTFQIVDSMLPTLPDEVVGAFYLIALAGMAFGMDVDIISFKGERVRVLGEFVTTERAVLGMFATLVILATYDWWSELILSAFVLTGWQAVGVVVMEIPLIIYSRSHRRMDNLMWLMLLIGLFLFLMPWVA